MRSPAAAVLAYGGVALLVGVTALPAYAQAAEPITVVANGVSQQVDVESVVTAASDPALERDGFDSAHAVVFAKQTFASYAAYALSPRAPGDDYPFRGGAYGSVSQLRYGLATCTDFVAWRLNRDAGSTHAPWKLAWPQLTPHGGNGHQWLGAWKMHGWPVSRTPQVGWVAWFDDASNGNNHVAYVAKVYDNGDVLIEDYNRVAPGEYGETRFPKGQIPWFLSPPPKSAYAY